MISETPNPIRITLTILTTLSFTPQLYTILSRKSSAGISLSYVLFNLLVATEQFTLVFFLMINVPEIGRGGFAHESFTLGDWLNFGQVGGTWVSFLILLMVCLYYRPRRCSAKGYIWIYVLYLSISVVPLLLDLVITPPPDGLDYREGFAFIHGLLLNTLAIPLGLVSFLCQTPQIWHYADPDYEFEVEPESLDSSFSLLGLGIQTLLFGALAVSWIWRFVYVDSGIKIGTDAMEWFWGGGWTVVHAGIFAGVQGGLLACGLWCRWKYRGGKETGTEAGGDGEREPLLGE
ncbi:hypothetical protein BJX99DRAFT_230850 [Aspergillus californicus]